MYLYRVTHEGQGFGKGQYFECSHCGQKYPEVEVFKTFFGLMPGFKEDLQTTLQQVFTLFNSCTPERYEENGEVRFCPYCGEPFYHVIDVYEDGTRSFRMAFGESWTEEERFNEILAPVELECKKRRLVRLRELFNDLI